MLQQNLQRWKDSSRGIKEIAFTDTEDITVNISSDDNNMFDSLVILEFSVKVPPPAIQWIMDKIKLVKSKGGSELSVCPIIDENYEVCCYISYTLLYF